MKKKSYGEIFFATSIALLIFACLCNFADHDFNSSDEWIVASDPRFDQIERAGYSWITTQKLISPKYANGSRRFVVYKIGAKIEQLEFTNAFIGTIQEADKWSFSGDGKWLLLNRDVQSNICLTIALDGSVIKTNAIAAKMVGQFFWMPNQATVLRISRDQGSLYGETNFGPTIIHPDFRPIFPIGFITDGLFLSATNDIDGQDQDMEYPKRLDLEFWNLNENAKIFKKVGIQIHGNNIVSATIAPLGNEIVWVCYSKSKMPNVCLDSKFPYLEFESNYHIEFYASSLELNKFKYIGSLPLSSNFPHLHWTADGQHVSFIQRNNLYMLPVN